MNELTKKLRAMEPAHVKYYRALIAALDALRAKGVYRRFYDEWYKRSSHAKGAHEEWLFDYMLLSDGSVDVAAAKENIQDAIKNCNAYIRVCKLFTANSPLQAYQDLQSAAEGLKDLFTKALFLLS